MSCPTKMLNSGIVPVVLIAFLITKVAGQCPDGSLPLSTCVNGACQGSLQCFSGSCCNSPVNIIGGQGCPTGSSFVTTCPANQVCPQGSACAGAACCTLPGTSIPGPIVSTTCPDGSTALSQCTNGFCGAGFTCNPGTNLCCTTPVTANLCPNGVPAISSCLNSNCPIGQGYSCTAGNLCCPGVAPPPQSNFFTCPNGQSAVAACLAGQTCGLGYQCFNNFCCPPATGTGLVANTRTCPNTGTVPVAACFTNQTCGQGYVCQAGFCCPPVNNNNFGRRKRRNITRADRL